LIPFLNLQAVNSERREEILSSIGRVIDSGWYILGNELKSSSLNSPNFVVPNIVLVLQWP